MTHPPRKGRRAIGVVEHGQLIANVLRLAEMIRRRYRPGRTTLQQLVLLIALETDCSRATAYRWAAEFTDALGLELAKAPVRKDLRG